MSNVLPFNISAPVTGDHYREDGYVIKMGDRLPHKMLSGELKHACRIVGDSRLIVFSPEAYTAFVSYKKGTMTESQALLLKVAMDQVGI